MFSDMAAGSNCTEFDPVTDPMDMPTPGASVCALARMGESPSSAVAKMDRSRFTGVPFMPNIGLILAMRYAKHAVNGIKYAE